MITVDEDRKAIVTWRRDDGYGRCSVYQTITNETWGIVRTTVNSDGYENQSHVTVEKWTDQSGFQLVIRHSLTDFTDATHYSPDREKTKAEFAKAAEKALSNLRKVMS